MLKTIIIICALVLFFLYIAPCFLLSFVLYNALLVRTKPTKWSRNYSVPTEEQLVEMYKKGAEWAEREKYCMNEVDTVSDGYRLVGEYYNFGFTKTVIIIPGRMESLKYSYFYAIPYKDLGYNVLVIDQRSHGNSEGRYNSLGYKEWRDVIEWAALLHENGDEEILLHGICIGSSTALFTLTADECPDYIVGMVADGMYTRFYETFKNHMIDQKRTLFPFLQLTMMYCKLCAGANVFTDGPLFRIEKLTKPILFLHSKEDIYSKPEVSSQIFEKCKSDKTVVWFEKGAHSRLRITDTAKYDGALADFIKKFE